MNHPSVTPAQAWSRRGRTLYTHSRLAEDNESTACGDREGAASLNPDEVTCPRCREGLDSGICPAYTPHMLKTTTSRRNRCSCGKSISKYARKCDACTKATLAANAASIADGKCPECRQAVRRNLSLAGWWQCSGFGAEGFRAAGSVPCSFQTFTE